MSKVLTDKEVAQIISTAIRKDLIDDAEQYRKFLEGLGELIAEHFGGEFKCVSGPLIDGPDEVDPSADRWCLHFRWDENVPEDGGVYAGYDTDVTIKNWKEGA